MVDVEKRVALQRLLRKIEDFENNIENFQDQEFLLRIIDQAQEEIEATDHLLAKVKAIEFLDNAKLLTQAYAENAMKNVDELIDITNKVYVTIDAYMNLPLSKKDNSLS
ncbi:hypothetical protein [Xanthocytophaga agilis]|uniref:Uncharacterized protein n=1 Tax=Xanthocytophaga agilis TaxID=3048010 RepID=A0AAE3R1K7_9BACT|nr:hypothetical protein [Xanthocytophaga agilis]MDJ1502121.1 hypothetical protein [Xanthocytophaga agilis]